MISDHLSQFDKYFLGSRITNLDNCILVDTDGTVRSHLEHILALSFDDRPGMTRDLVGHIQYLLESTASARDRSDAYKFYFLSNIALHEIVRLTYISTGKMEYNYNPPQSKVDPILSSSMDLSKSGPHIERLVNGFLEQLDKLDEIEILMKEKAHRFCQLLLERENKKE